MEVNWDDFKCRCSAIKKICTNSSSNPVLTEKQTEILAKYRAKLESGGSLTTNQQLEMVALEEKEENGKRVILSTTCIEYLMIVYAWTTEGMIPVDKESMDLIAAMKGKETESESIDMLTDLDGIPYMTHKDQIYNDYLTGEIDAYAGASIYQARTIIDVKQSFHFPTFLKKLNTGLEDGQEEQVQGYMDISGAGEGYIANTLVTCPEEIINDMKWKLARRLNALTIESPDFLKEWAVWEHSMRFDHMPIHKRISKIKIEPFTAFKREKVYDRVKICREWLNGFHERYCKLNLK